MKIKVNYLVIPLITIVVALVGSFFTTSGMAWYDNEIIKPVLTPPDWAFPVAWNIIFVLTMISALIFWNKIKNKSDREVLTVLFLGNAFLNICWSFLFFYQREILVAFWEMLVLEITIIFLIIFLYRISKIASWLLVPYGLWVGFASYLTWQIFQLN